jgi:hypothetical protein
MAKERKTAKFDLQLGAYGRAQARQRERHLNIWYHGQGDCLFLHPMDDAADGGSRADFLSSHIYKLRRER